jgi:hypothetical protein
MSPTLVAASVGWVSEALPITFSKRRMGERSATHHF